MEEGGDADVMRAGDHSRACVVLGVGLLSWCEGEPRQVVLLGPQQLCLMPFTLPLCPAAASHP
jgi:hypothetical protein